MNRNFKPVEVTVIVVLSVTKINVFSCTKFVDAIVKYMYKGYISERYYMNVYCMCVCVCAQG